MAMNNGANKQYKTMKGKIVDLELLRQRNEMTPAVGNARVNARGDELGAGGKIIRKKEDKLRDYYADNPATVPDESVAKTIVADEPVAEETSSKPKTTRAQKKVAAKVEEEIEAPTAAELAEFDDEDWVEDDDGNFVQKGD